MSGRTPGRNDQSLREPKPYWRDVPPALRLQIEAVMGARIRSAVRVFGGYGPSATFRISLQDARTVFAKGAGNTSNAENWRVVPLEESIYRTVEAVRDVGPHYFGSVAVDGWHLLLLEDLRDVRKAPPWRAGLAERAIHDIAQFHLRGMREADKLDVIGAGSLAGSWAGLRDRDREGFLRLFADRWRQADAWLTAAIDALDDAASHMMDPDQPWGLVHNDIRSDNLCFRAHGPLVLFDWPFAGRGPLIADIAFFVPSVRAEGGPEPSLLVAEYKRVMAGLGVEIPHWAERATAAATAGYFASRAGRPPIEGLPRLRQVQQMQLRAALPWAASVLGLPDPPALVL